MSESLVVAVDQSVATITISRPARYNALDFEAMNARRKRPAKFGG